MRSCHHHILAAPRWKKRSVATRTTGNRLFLTFCQVCLLKSFILTLFFASRPIQLHIRITTVDVWLTCHVYYALCLCGRTRWRARGRACTDTGVGGRRWRWSVTSKYSSSHTHSFTSFTINSRAFAVDSLSYPIISSSSFSFTRTIMCSHPYSSSLPIQTRVWLLSLWVKPLPG